MSNTYQFQTNMTDEFWNEELLKIGIFSTLSTVPSCVFLFINGTMLFTLRSKPVFRETCRYILLYNLLFADTVQLAQNQLHYLLSVSKVKLPNLLCIVLNFLANLPAVISPLTLVVMSLERYVAVCYPLRHATIITIRNTRVAVTVIWMISLINHLIRVSLFFDILFQKVAMLHMKDLCSNIAILLSSRSAHYDTAYTCFVFVSAGVAVIFSYTGVVLAARSASTDKNFAHKARNTLLLNLMQLCLSVVSTIYYPLFVALSKTVTWIVFSWIRNIFFVCFINLPRCLSSLIYGLRDQTIRPVLIYYLYCRMKTSVKQASS